MRILVTGSTGFTGSHTVPQLLAHGHDVKCFARPTSDRSPLANYDVEWCVGDVADPSTLTRALIGVDAIVNIVSLGFGHAPGIVQAIEQANIKRAVFISTTALFTTLNVKSKSIRIAAETTIKQSQLDYTILRPTMIYGSARDRNMCRLIRFIKKYPVIPIFGSGNNSQQPIHVNDVAAAIEATLDNPRTYHKSYNIAGGDALNYNQVIDTISDLMRKRILKLHLPAAPTIAALRLIEQSSIKLPIKAEQLQRLNEDKAISYEEAANDLAFQPCTFRDGIQRELEIMRLLPST